MLPFSLLQNPAGEIQGQTLLGKFTTHEYYSTNKVHNDASELHRDIMQFFKHYRSLESQQKYSVLGSSEFENEFKLFENYIKEYWSIKTCENFYLGVRTHSVESFFSTRLFHVPKNIRFTRTYKVKMICCMLQWNERHISEIFTRIYGHGGIENRMRWYQNIQSRVFEKHKPHTYVKSRRQISKKRRRTQLEDEE